jgi:flagellar biosynthesis/type III secretory pathway chaperone
MALEESIKILHLIFKDFLQLLEKLHEVIQQEHAALVMADVASIERESFRKQSYLEQMHRLDSQCIACIKRFSSQDFLPRDLQQIFELIEKTDFFQAKELAEMGKSLKKKLDLVMLGNGNNQALVMRSLEHIENMKKNLLGKSHAPTYTPSGKSTAWSHSHRFLREI